MAGQTKKDKYIRIPWISGSSLKISFHQDLITALRRFSVGRRRRLPPEPDEGLNMVTRLTRHPEFPLEKSRGVLDTLRAGVR